MNKGAPLAQVFAAADAGVALGRTSPDLVSVPLDTIVPCRWQPRQVFEAGALLDLAKDIEQHGVLTPPLVWMNEDGEWELIAGERRVRACYALCLAAAGKINPLEKAVAHVAEQGFGGLARELRWQIRDSLLPAVLAVATVPCREVWGSVAQLHELALVDNLQRADLTALEEARALKDLIGEYGYSQRVLGERLGKSQTWVSQRLNLLGLTPEVAGLVERGEVDPATAREIARLEKEVQAPVVAHLQKFGMKSKQAAAFVGTVLEMSDPEHYVGGTVDPNTNPAGKRLIHVALQDIPEPALRQEAVLRYAGEKNEKGRIIEPRDTGTVKALLAASGIAGAGTSGYDVDITKLWVKHGPGAGYTCETCVLNPQRALVGEINDLVRANKETNNFNDARWPKCAADVRVCSAWRGAGEPLKLALPYFSGSDAGAVITPEEQAHIDDHWPRSADDIEVWAAVIRRYYAYVTTRDVVQAKQKANGLAAVLERYLVLQRSGELTPQSIHHQRCGLCVFHKVDSDDPKAHCQLQGNPPGWNDYDTATVRLWESGNTVIGRCRLFRLKQPEVNLPELPQTPNFRDEDLLYLLQQCSEQENYGRNTRYGPRWFEAKRTQIQNQPSWGDCVPALKRLIPELTPGRRLALLLLWQDPFHWQGTMMSRSTEVEAYMPQLGRMVPYTLKETINRS